MNRLFPEDLGEPVSYSTRRETPGETVRNRIGVTAALFSIAMGASYLLGREQR